MKWQSMSNLLGKEQITNKQHQETGFPQKVFITKKYDTQPGSTTTSTNLSDDKPKRKLYENLDVGSPQKIIKTSPNF